MIHPFRYQAPATREELHGLLADPDSGSVLLGGGTDLLVAIRSGALRPRRVLDVKRVRDFPGLEWSAQEGLLIGPRVTVDDLLNSGRVREDFPLLAACAADLASPQIRNRATVIGNVANASPCSDLAPALLCLEARATLSSRRGVREVPFRTFFTGVKRSVLAPGEVLEGITVPAASAGARGGYRKLKRIQGHDLALVGVALLKQDGALRLGVSSAAPTPVFVGTLGCGDPADDVVAAVLAAVSPISDLRCTREYRLHMIEVFVRRLLGEVEG
jgi:carbon-monoxide dehydrogenase medium subunit